MHSDHLSDLQTRDSTQGPWVLLTCMRTTEVLPLVKRDPPRGGLLTARSPRLTDIQFWNSRQSLEGLSVRSVFFGVFQSFVVLLYILDNETNFVVQVSVFIGVLIDLWKITKVMDVRVRQGHHAIAGPVGRGLCHPAQPQS